MKKKINCKFKIYKDYIINQIIMPGGLLQLVQKGKEDGVLIGNPEITFFKCLFKKHNDLYIFQSDSVLGKHTYNKKYTHTIHKKGDLLYNLYFKVEIPFFTLSNESTNTIIQYSKHNINSLKIIYKDFTSIVVNNNNEWFIYPINMLTNKHLLNNNITIIDKKIKKILNLDIDNDTFSIILPNISNTNQITNDIILYMNFWEQKWLLYIIDNKINNQLFTNISFYKNIFNSISEIFYNTYHKINDKHNIFINSNKKSEINQYFSYINNLVNDNDEFDIDISYMYCIEKNLKFNDYINNIKYNPLILLIILKFLYSPDQTFSFWKKNIIKNNNEIIDGILLEEFYYYKKEWKQNLDKITDNIFNNFNLPINLDNTILDYFKNEYFNLLNTVINLYSNIKINNSISLYIKLKRFADRFIKIPYTTINFNNYYITNEYNDTYNYIETLTEINNYEKLITNFNNLDTDDITLNLNPMNMENIYCVIAYELIQYIIDEFNLTYNNISCFVLWRNCIITRIYKKFLDSRDIEKANNYLFTYNENRSNIFYYSIYPTNLFLYDDFIYSFYEMFFKNSFICSISDNILIVDLLNNINDIHINNSNIINGIIENKIIENNKKMYELSILNNYFVEKYDYIHDIEKNILYIKYDNNYNKSSLINIYNNTELINYNNITYIYNNVFNTMSLTIYLTDVITIDVLSITVEYINQVYILNFINDIVESSRHIDKHTYVLIKKNNHIILESNIIDKYSILINNNVINYNIHFLNILYTNGDNKNIHVNLIRNDNIFSLKDEYGNIIELPIDYVDITEISIQSHNTFIDNIITDFIINYDNTIILDNLEPFSYYYLVNKHNYKNMTKLISVKKNIYYSDNILTHVNTSDNIDNTYNIVYYVITYYNNITGLESLSSNIYSFYTKTNIPFIEMSINIETIPGEYDSINIYRCNGTDQYYYKLSNITNLNNNFIDIYDDYNLVQVYNNKILYIGSDSLSYDFTNVISVLKINYNLNKTYKYKITYYNSKTNIESLPSKTYIYNINLPITFSINVNIPNNYDKINIYRTKNEKNIFYKIKYNNENIFIDNNEDDTLVEEYIPYVILQIREKNIVPNLNSFISHSTDLTFKNDKSLTDLSDFVFNTNFIMVNDISNPTFLYMYNIPFKICNNSKITINNIKLEYIIPVASKQFFIYNDDIETNKFKISEHTFNPSFDIFGINTEYLKNNTISKNINNIIKSLENLINSNIDYDTIIKTMIHSNNEYINTFNNLIKKYNGSTFSNILKMLPSINKINNGAEYVYYDLLTYNNDNYYNYNHYAFNFFQNNYDIFTFQNTTIKFLTPVYLGYKSKYKLSSDVEKYLLSVPVLFDNNINYVNNNIDYITKFNYLNYNINSLSRIELEKEKINTLNIVNTLSIQLLHPLITKDNILEIIINEKKHKINKILNDNNVIINDYNDYVNDTTLNNANLVFNDNNKYFSYGGIININTDEFNNIGNKLILMDNDKIINNYNIHDNSLIITNPKEITLDNNNFVEKNIDFINQYFIRYTDKKYFYSIEINYSKYKLFNHTDVHFLYNNTYIKGKYNYINEYKGILTFISDYNVYFFNNYIIFKLYDDIFETLEYIEKYIIIKHEDIYYEYHDSYNILDKSDILSINNNLCKISDIIKITNSGNNIYYFTNKLITSLIIYYNVGFFKKSALYINKELIINQYGIKYNDFITMYDNSYYILIINYNDNYINILTINDLIKLNLVNNYHHWVYKKKYLNFIKININDNNISNLPKNSFYMLENKEIYYYSKGMFNINNRTPLPKLIKEVYLIDNQLFDDDIKLQYRINKTVEYTTNDLYKSNMIQSVDSVQDLYTNLFNQSFPNKIIRRSELEDDQVLYIDSYLEKNIDTIIQFNYTYKYKVKYKNSIDSIDSVESEEIEYRSDVKINHTNTIKLSNFTIYDNYNIIEIYRTEFNENIFYYLDKIDLTDITEYVDNNEFTANILYEKNINTSNIKIKTFFINYTYKYRIVYNKKYITKNEQIIMETCIDNINTVLIKDILHLCDIYRTKYNTDIYYLIAENIIHEYIDNSNDDLLVIPLELESDSIISNIIITENESMYYYTYTFYNSITRKESAISANIISSSTYNIKLFNFDNFDKKIYDSIKIYRTKNLEYDFYYLSTVLSEEYVDTINDDELSIYYKTLDLTSIVPIYNIYKYKYKITILYDKYNITNESISSNELSVILNNVIGVGDIIFDFSLINKIQYYGFNIYRTKLDSNDFYYLDTIEKTMHFYIDNKKDEKLILLYNNLSNNRLIYDLNLPTVKINYPNKYIYTYKFTISINNVNKFEYDIPQKSKLILREDIKNVILDFTSIKIKDNENINIYRTKRDSDNFYFIGTYINTENKQFTDNKTDNDLINKLSESFDYSIYDLNFPTSVYDYNYKYIIVYLFNDGNSYITENFMVSINSDPFINNVILNFENIEFDSLTIYRTKNNDDNYYIVPITPNDNKVYIDNVTDNNLNDLFSQNIVLLKNTILLPIIDLTFKYKYKFTKVNSNNKESTMSDIKIVYSYSITTINIVKLLFTNNLNNSTDYIKIYRTRLNEDVFYYLDKILDVSGMYIDNKPDELLTNINDDPYNIKLLKMNVIKNKYMYVFTEENNGIETNISENIIIDISDSLKDNPMVIDFENITFYKINIYRTKLNETTYFQIGSIYNNELTFIDKVEDDLVVQPLKSNLSGNYNNDLPIISHNNRKMIKYIIVALDENGNENRMSVPLVIETNNDIVNYNIKLNFENVNYTKFNLYKTKANKNIYYYINTFKEDTKDYFDNISDDKLIKVLSNLIIDYNLILPYIYIINCFYIYNIQPVNQPNKIFTYNKIYLSDEITSDNSIKFNIPLELLPINITRNIKNNKNLFFDIDIGIDYIDSITDDLLNINNTIIYIKSPNYINLINNYYNIYKFSYFNNINKTESLISNEIEIRLNNFAHNNKITIFNIPITYPIKYNSINIYKFENNEYKLLDNINTNNYKDTATIMDNKQLQLFTLYNNIKKYKYSYLFTLYNTISKIESVLQKNEIYTYNINNNTPVQIYDIDINLIYNTNFNCIKIYRNKINNNDNYYFVAITNNNTFIDYVDDIYLTIEYNKLYYDFKCLSYNNYSYKYIFSSDYDYSNIINVNFNSKISDTNKVYLNNINPEHRNIDIYRSFDFNDISNNNFNNILYYVGATDKNNYIDNKPDYSIVDKYKILPDNTFKCESLYSLRCIYHYIFTYYNDISDTETINSNILTIELNNFIENYESISMTNFGIIPEEYTKINIYRTKLNNVDDTFYYIGNTNNNYFTDNKNDSELLDIYNIRGPDTCDIYPIYEVNKIIITYYYKISFFDSTMRNNETLLSDYKIISCDYEISEKLSIRIYNLFFHKDYDSIKIYRSIGDLKKYYCIGITKLTSFVDNIIDGFSLNKNILNISPNYSLSMFNNSIYIPKKFTPGKTTNFNINYTVKINLEDIDVNSELVIIYYNNDIILTNESVNNLNNEYIKLGILYINNIYSLNPYIIIDENNMISIHKTLLKNNEIQLWKINIRTDVNELYTGVFIDHLYIWTMYSDRYDYVTNYLKYILDENSIFINQPINDIIINSSYNLLYYDYRFFTKNNNILSILTNQYEKDPKKLIVFDKYYQNFCDTGMNFIIKNNDYNNILNIKPKLIIINNIENIISVNIKYYITVNNNIINIYYSDPIISINSTIYASYEYAYYINDNIVLHKYNDIYLIYSKNKYLETSEIILLNNCFFKIMGLNANDESYTAMLINNSNLLNNTFTGYYTFGNIVNNNNKKIPNNLKIDTRMIFYSEKNINQREIYFDNETINLSDKNIITNNIFMFSNSGSYVDMYYQNNELYVIDNYVKIKNFDLLIYNDNNILSVNNINNGQIIFEKLTFFDIPEGNIKLYLPYQPFEVFYVNIVNGFITNITLNDSEFVLLDTKEYNNKKLYKLINNTIYHKNNVIVPITKTLWIKYINTNYSSFYDNILKIPNIQKIDNMINDYPIEITINKIGNYFVCDIELLNKFIFYYMQPVYICGAYNKITYIKIINDKGFILNFKYNIISTKTKINLIISPYIKNLYNYYTGNKITYENRISPISNTLNTYKLLYYKLKNDKLIKVEVLEIVNFDTINNLNDGYTHLYFLNYNQFDIKTKKIIKMELLIGNYYLLSEKTDVDDIIYLIKLESNNKLKFYTDIIITNNIYYINKIIECVVNKNYEFSLSNMQIKQVESLPKKNNDNIQIIYKYSTKFIDSIIFDNNLYYQKIQIINIDINLLNVIDKVFIDIDKNIYINIIVKQSEIFLVSEKYILCDFITVYVLINNSIFKTTNTFIDKINTDTFIYEKLMNTKYELLQFNIKLKKIKEKTYYYSLIDESDYVIDDLNMMFYSINDKYNNVIYIGTNLISFNEKYSANLLILSKDIENFNENYLYKIWFKHSIDNTNYFNNIVLFDDFEDLHEKIFLANKSTVSEIYYMNKPWENWSLLNTVNNSIPANKFLFSSQKIIIKWDTNLKIITDDKIDCWYLTNYDYNILSTFITIINNSPIHYENYIFIKNVIEPKLHEILPLWLSEPYFFLNVSHIVNEFLLNAFDNKVYFDGNNILFYNIDPVYINNNIELANYLTTEYVFNKVNNIVYRNNNINLIKSDFNKLGSISPIFNSFGTSIHKIIRSLVKLGEQITILHCDCNSLNINNHGYLSSYKYFIDKMCYKYNKNYPTEFKFLNFFKNNQYNDYLISTNDLNIKYISENLLEEYYIINSDNNILSNYTMEDINKYTIVYNDISLNITNKLHIIIMNIFNYLNSSVNLISKYSYNNNRIDFYVNQLLSYDSFIIMKESSEYIINNLTLIGIQNNLNDDINIYNFNIINDIVINTNRLTIYKKNTNNLVFINNFIIETNDIMIIKYNISVNNYHFIDDTYFFIFINDINYVLDNTYIQIDNKTFPLYISSKNEYYITHNLKLDITNIVLFNNISLNKSYKVYKFTTIKDIFYKNTYTYILFNTDILFIENNTEIQISNNIYKLYYDYEDANYYIDYSIQLNNNMECQYINTTKFNIFENDFTIYQGILNEPILNYFEKTIDYQFLYNGEKINIIDMNIRNNNIIDFTVNEKINGNEIKIIYTNKIGIDIISKIKKCTFLNKYIYSLNKNIPISDNTKLILFEGVLNIDKIIDYLGFECFKKDSNTYIVSDYIINTVDIYNYIIVSEWDLKYVKLNDYIKFELPTNFIYDKNNYYKLNDVFINFDKIGDIINDNILKEDKLVLKQIYTDKNVIITDINNNNNYEIELFNSIDNFSINDNVFLYPYELFDYYIDGKSMTFLHLYNVEISINEIKKIDNIDNVIDIIIPKIFYLISLNIKHTCILYNYNIEDYMDNKIYTNGIIFSVESDIIKKYIITNIIIASEEFINTENVFLYSPLINYTYINIKHNTNLLFDIKYHKNLNNKYINFCSKKITTSNIYSLYLLEYNNANIENNDISTHNSMMENINFITNEIKNIIPPKWTDVFNFFKYIQLYFDDQLIEELNSDVYKINYNLYSMENNRKQLDKFKINANGDRWQFYLPLIFWFNRDSTLSLPLLSMVNTNIRLKYNINDITDILNVENNKFDKNPEFFITLISDLITLEESERKYFIEKSHNYIINNYVTYPTKYINSYENNIYYKLSGLVKDIYMITELSDLSIDEKYTSVCDYKFTKYKYHLNNLNLIPNGNDINDIYIIKNNIIEYNNYINSTDKSSFTRIHQLIKIFHSYPIWNDELLKYLMYYEDKYLSDNSNIEYALTTYIKYQYVNKLIDGDINILKSIKMTCGNTDVFTSIDSLYFNSVIPYNKFNNSLPENFYVYTFSLNPLDNQPSGHLNFINIDNVIFSLSSNINDYILKIITKDYNVIRIMGGQASLAWL